MAIKSSKLLEPVSQTRVYEVGKKDGNPVNLTLIFEAVSSTKNNVVLKMTGTSRSLDWETRKGIQSFITPLQGSSKKNEITPSIFKGNDWDEMLKGDAFEALRWVARQLPDFDQKLIDSMKNLGFEVSRENLEEYLKVMREVSNRLTVEKENPDDPKAKGTGTRTQEIS